MPNWKEAPAVHPCYALRSRAGHRGDGGLSASAPATPLLPRGHNLVSSLPTSSKYWEDTCPVVNLKPPNDSTVCRQHLWQDAGTTCLRVDAILLPMEVDIINHSLHCLEPFKTLGLNPQEAQPSSLHPSTHALRRTNASVSSRRFWQCVCFSEPELMFLISNKLYFFPHELIAFNEQASSRTSWLKAWPYFEEKEKENYLGSETTPHIN